MRRFSLGLAFAVMIPSLSARDSNAGQTEFVGWDVVPKTGLCKHFVVTVTDERLKRTPSWERQNENPPLSARSALKIADDFRKISFKDPPGWKWDFVSLSLRHNGSSTASGK